MVRPLLVPRRAAGMLIARYSAAINVSMATFVGSQPRGFRSVIITVAFRPVRADGRRLLGNYSTTDEAAWILFELLLYGRGWSPRATLAILFPPTSTSSALFGSIRLFGYSVYFISGSGGLFIEDSFADIPVSIR